MTKGPRVKGGAPAGVQCAMIVEGGAEQYAELFWYYGNEYDHFPSVDAVTLRMVCPDSTSTPVVSYYGDNPEIAALAELPVVSQFFEHENQPEPPSLSSQGIVTDRNQIRWSSVPGKSST